MIRFRETATVLKTASALVLTLGACLALGASPASAQVVVVRPPVSGFGPAPVPFAPVRGFNARRFYGPGGFSRTSFYGYNRGRMGVGPYNRGWATGRNFRRYRPWMR